MKKTEKQVKKPLDWLKLCCVIYTPITIFINLLCYLLLHGLMLQAWANLIVFALSAIIGTIIFFCRKSNVINNIITNTAWIYTAISFSINTYVFIAMDGSLWTIFTIFLIFAYALITAIILKYLKVNSFLIHALTHYVLSLCSFLIMTLAIAKYNSGNSAMLLFSIFSVAYIVIAICYYLIKRSLLNLDNEEKEYKRQFD